MQIIPQRIAAPVLFFLILEALGSYVSLKLKIDTRQRSAKLTYPRVTNNYIGFLKYNSIYFLPSKLL